MFAQLRDVLAAEDSSVVAQEHNHGPALFPKRAQPHRGAIGVRQNNTRKRCA
jgi:hypothetical protein